MISNNSIVNAKNRNSSNVRATDEYKSVHATVTLLLTTGDT